MDVIHLTSVVVVVIIIVIIICSSSSSSSYNGRCDNARVCVSDL